MKAGEGIADIALGAVVVIPDVQAEAVTGAAGAGADTSHSSPVRAAGQVNLGIRLCLGNGRLEVQAAAKGPHPVGGTAHAALQLGRIQHCGKGGQIDPEHLLRLGVIVGDAVQGDIHSGGVAAADTDLGIAKAGAALVHSHHRRLKIKHHWQRRGRILKGNLTFVQLAVGHRTLGIDPAGRHHDAVQRGHQLVVFYRKNSGIVNILRHQAGAQRQKSRNNHQ